MVQLSRDPLPWRPNRASIGTNDSDEEHNACEDKPRTRMDSLLASPVKANAAKCSQFCAKKLYGLPMFALARLTIDCACSWHGRLCRS